MHSADFHARDCTTSRWLCQEIMKNSWFVPLPIATVGFILNRVADWVWDSVSGGTVSVSMPAGAEPVSRVFDAAASATSRLGAPAIACMASSSSDTDDQLPAADEADCVAAAEEFTFTSSGTFNCDAHPKARNIPLPVGPKKFRRDLNDEPITATCGVGVQRAAAVFWPRVPRTNKGSPGLMQYSSTRILSDVRRP